MGVLAAYHGVVEKEGIVRLRQAPPIPVGTEVVVVVAQPIPAVEEQERRLAALRPEEWTRPFEEFEAVVAHEPAEADVSGISDEEFVALVHEARRGKA